MLLNFRYWPHNALVLGIATMTLPALAEGPSGVSDGPVAQSSILGASDLDTQSLLPKPLSSEELGNASGRQGVTMQLQYQLNNNDQNALVSDNVLSGSVVTGTNSISDHAFGNMSGIATVIQNTGNQVVIQDSTMINILVNP